MDFKGKKLSHMYILRKVEKKKTFIGISNALFIGGINVFEMSIINETRIRGLRMKEETEVKLQIV